MNQERRNAARLEPRAARAKVSPIRPGAGRGLVGIVLDASAEGIAVMTHEIQGASFAQWEKVNVRVFSALSEDEGVDLGLATITRTWTDTNTSGIAINLDQPVCSEASELILSGTRKNVRVDNQAKLAELDMDKAHTHVQSMHDCQLKLLIVALTVAAALGSAYLTLSYHSAILGEAHVRAQELSYWRAWIAALPGLLAIAVASLITQKIGSVARNEAFLDVLKECRITGQYPREYRGWEDAYRKFKFCYKSRLCERCKSGRCGEFTSEEKQLYVDMELMTKSVPNVFHMVIYGILVTIGLLSSLAFANEVLKNKLAGGAIMGIGITFGIVIVVSSSVLLWSIIQIRTGKYSFAARRRLWADLLERCPYRV